VIPLTLEEVTRLVGGGLRVQPGAERVTGVRIDPSRAGPGDLFVAADTGPPLAALRRQWRVRTALRRGATAALASANDTADLAALALAVRDRSTARFIGITGSVGKTTTKDLLAALLAPHRRTVAAEESFNNDFGVPLTVCRVGTDTEVCVLELGMRGFGHIEEIAAIARPDVAIVTSIGPAHVGLVGGSLDGVARAKAELLQALPTGGVAIVPADAPALEPYLRHNDVEVRRFDVSALRAFEVVGDRSHLKIEVGGAEIALEAPFTARPFALNLVAALHAYDALGLPLHRAHEGLADLVLSPLRLEERPLPGGGLLIDDCYNASPTSMLAALEHLAARAAGRRTVAFLGEMHELGDAADTYHREAGRRAAALGIEQVVGVGALARPLVEETDGTWVASAGAARRLARKLVGPDDCVLVKASRAVGLEVLGATLSGRRRVSRRERRASASATTAP
jgi:UDP-N-acetylmuramoyl-tripeptide--D-alanyl-D-alanine ligase